MGVAGSSPVSLNMDQATFLEEFSEDLQIRYEQYILSGLPAADGLGKNEKLAIIYDFVKWVKQESANDLVAPRCPDGKSFLQRRQDAVMVKK